MTHAAFLAPSARALAVGGVSAFQQSLPATFSAFTKSTTGLPMSSASVDGPIMTQLAQQAPEPTGVYDAVLPSTETLLGMGFVVLLCAACAWCWNEQVVPVSRTNLAISKSRGEVKEYLDELRATDPRMHQMGNSTVAAAMNATSVEGVETEHTDEGPKADDRALERWLFTDWLIDNKSEKKAGRQKEPALPILKSAKWNSGDNPVVVAASLMLVGLLFTALTERISTIF